MPYAKMTDFDADLQDPVVRRPGCLTWIVLLILATFDRIANLW